MFKSSILEKMTAASAAPASIPRRSVLYTIDMLAEGCVEEDDRDREREANQTPDCGWMLKVSLLGGSPEECLRTSDEAADRDHRG
jgi:hypothetical protein